MKKQMTTLSFLGLLFLCGTIFQNSVFAQENNNQMHVKTYNFESFSTQQKDLTKELEELTSSEFYSHPEFGYLPYNAPCEDCYELLQNRTDSARMFVEKGTNGTSFYSQKCYGIFNYKNDKGELISIDPRLKKKSDGIYAAERQAVMPTELNIPTKQSSFNLPNGEKFAFNRKVEMLYISPLNQITNLGEANWTNYTVGEEGIRVINAWPNVDIEIAYRGDAIKSSYVIKAPLGYANGQIAFRDNLSIPSDFEMNATSDGGYEITSQTSPYKFEINPAFGYDQSGVKERGHGFQYDFETQTNQLSILVPISWTTDLGAIYPLVVDPLVTSSATFSGGIITFGNYANPWCSGGSSTGDCGFNLVVPKPANATLTSATFNAQTISGSGSSCGVCWMQEAGYYITSPCGSEPANLSLRWSCQLANPGTCTGTNLDVSSLVTCMTPVCAGNVTFQMVTTRCYCGGGCGTQPLCQQIPNNSWSMTITGRTLQTIGNQIYNVASCAGTTTLMNPNPTFGVPGYSYVWSNGATTPTINANNAQSPYTVTVTDACGIANMVTFTVNCPLSVTLNNFTAEKINRQVLLAWETASEKDNDYFLIERAGENGEFSSIGKKQAIGNSNTLQSYSFYDENPLMGTSYYRLKIYDTQGNESTSEVKSVGFDGGNELKIIPNPNKGNYQIAYHFPEKGTYLIELFSTRGEKLMSNEISIDNSGYKQVKLDELSLPTGVYYVKLHTNNQVLVEKMIVE